MSSALAVELLREIMSCPNVAVSRNDLSLPYHKIVCSQDNPDEPFQLPEPWSGFLESAPILFVGSNPSISYNEDYPLDTPLWPLDRASRFFTHRFHDGWVKDGRYGRFRNSGYSKRRTSYRASVRQRAIELFERDVIPGKDYCMTEVVHCKSKGQVGVREATPECAKLYLRRTLEVSGAKVAIVMGDYAIGAVASQFGLVAEKGLQGPIRVHDRQVQLVFTLHPAAFGPKKLVDVLKPSELRLLREFVS